MPQSPKQTKRRKVSRKALEQDDHTLMEAIFGKRIMRKIDALLDEKNADSDTTK